MICERWDGKTCRRLSLRYIVLLRDRTLGTQVPGVRSPAEQGTKNLQPSLYVFAEQHGEETVLPHGTHKKPVFSIYIGHPQWLTLTIPRFLQVCPRSYWHRTQ